MDKLNFRISHLIYRYLIGDLDDESEISELNNWRSQSDANEKLFNKLLLDEDLEAYRSRVQLFSADSGWERFRKEKRIKKIRQFYNSGSFFRYAAIISVILCASAIGIWMYTQREVAFEIVEETQPKKIVPGNSRAILTLSSGTELQLLDDSILSANKISELDPKSNTDKQDEILSYSMIEIPRGGEYCLLLSDGTTVYLNSETRLRFPEKFSKDKREIELIGGEIYLDVKRNENSPFLIKIDGMLVRVLGTSFNISTYNEVYQTTLVNGAIEVQTVKGESYQLKPSQQLNYTKDNGKVNIQYVDTDLYTSWVDGQIVFRDQTLENIMNSLSRWYNFEVKYENAELRMSKFGINVNKYDNIQPILNILESTDKLKFEIKDNTVYIRQNRNLK